MRAARRAGGGGAVGEQHWKGAPRGAVGRGGALVVVLFLCFIEAGVSAFLVVVGRLHPTARGLISRRQLQRLRWRQSQRPDDAAASIAAARAFDTHGVVAYPPLQRGA